VTGGRAVDADKLEAVDVETLGGRLVVEATLVMVDELAALEINGPGRLVDEVEVEKPQADVPVLFDGRPAAVVDLAGLVRDDDDSDGRAGGVGKLLPGLVNARDADVGAVRPVGVDRIALGLVLPLAPDEIFELEYEVELVEISVLPAVEIAWLNVLEGTPDPKPEGTAVARVPLDSALVEEEVRDEDPKPEVVPAPAWLEPRLVCWRLCDVALEVPVGTADTTGLPD